MMRSKNANALTDKQERFVQELIRGKSQREAYKASYNAKKMLNKTIDERASVLFSNDKVRTRYTELHGRLLQESENECIADAKEVLKALTRVLRRQEMESVVVIIKKTRSYIDDTGKRCTETVEKPVMVMISTRVSDMNKAADMLGKHFKLFTDNINVDGDMAFSINIDYGEY